MKKYGTHGARLNKWSYIASNKTIFRVCSHFAMNFPAATLGKSKTASAIVVNRINKTSLPYLDIYTPTLENLNRICIFNLSLTTTYHIKFVEKRGKEASIEPQTIIVLGHHRKIGSARA